MNSIFARAAVAAALLATSATPALAVGPSSDAHGAANAHRLAAPGQYCKAESKQHVAGTPGTPFSLCVKAQAKLRHSDSTSPHQACRAESKQHVAGTKGTPFSQCVSAGAKLRHAQDQDA